MEKLDKKCGGGEQKFGLVFELSWYASHLIGHSEPCRVDGSLQKEMKFESDTDRLDWPSFSN